MAYKSVSATFKTDLGSLMGAIHAADPHFVRCVNPNSQKRAEMFEDQKAVEQLRCGGVIEAVRMCRESFPSRYLHADFHGIFSCICPRAQGNDDRSRVLSMVQMINIDPNKYRLGKTMILLKREVVDGLERMRAQLLGDFAVVLQLAVRRWIAREELRQKREVRKKYLSALVLQGAVRRCFTRTKYLRMVQAMRVQERQNREQGKSAPDPEPEMQMLRAAAPVRPHSPLVCAGATLHSHVLSLKMPAL